MAFVTGGAGDICSAQTKALVRLGANACILGRSIEKTERAAVEIAAVRKGARVLGLGGVDVRNVSCRLHALRVVNPSADGRCHRLQTDAARHGGVGQPCSRRDKMHCVKEGGGSEREMETGQLTNRERATFIV